MSIHIRPIHSLQAGLLAAGLQFVIPACDGALDVAVDINVSTAGGLRRRRAPTRRAMRPRPGQRPR
ncbi:hypothetical protein [Nannocystis pusilla]|uniref:hypothetical protein n=1 Tax=Nannocystis pusilla TaxID=889268 RepID=UPI003B7F71CB